MEGDKLDESGNGIQIDGEILQTFQPSFQQVQDLLDQNKVLIIEINQNHESKKPENLIRNVDLIKELNKNIKRVAELYGDLSDDFTKIMNDSSKIMKGSSTKTGSSGSKQSTSRPKRNRS